MLVHAKELDDNGDGTVERQELLDQTQQAFAMYDRDRDGKLTEGEYGGRGGGMPRHAMAGYVKGHAEELDRDGDGVIRKDEMLVEVTRLFGKADKNRDGKLTADEYANAAGQRDGERRRGGRREDRR